MEPNDWLEQLGYLERSIQQMTIKDHLNILIGLFSNESTHSQIVKLKQFYEANTIMIKTKTLFKEDLFFQTLLHDILCWMPKQKGVFDGNKIEAGILIDLFCCCVSALNETMLNDLEIRFCFALLPEFFSDDRSTKAINHITNFLNLIYVKDKLFFKNNGLSIIQSTNLVFYELIRKQSINILLNAKQECIKEIPNITNKIKALKQEANISNTQESIDPNTQKPIDSNIQESIDSNTQTIDPQLLIVEENRKKQEFSLSKEEVVLSQTQKQLNQLELLLKTMEIQIGLMEGQIVQCRNHKILNFKEFSDLTSLTCPYFNPTLANYIKDENEKTVIGKEINIFFALIRNYSSYKKFWESVPQIYFEENEGMKNAYTALMKDLEKDAKTQNYTKFIKEIITDMKNITLFYNILTSPAVKQYYSKENEKMNEETIQCYDLIPQFKQENQNEIIQFIKDTIIVIPLEKRAKGITISYLRTAINPRWIKVFAEEHENFIELLKVYVFITLFHESNHLIKRYYRNNVTIDEAKTPREEEGGEKLIEYFFKYPIIKDINLDEAKNILTLKNWDKASIICDIVKPKPKSKKGESNTRTNYVRYMNEKKIKEKWDCILR